MVETGVMEDYTWLWYDVRPHPNFGTVEIRAMDAQTHVEHTLGARGADPGDGQGARRALRRRASSSRDYPYEMLDENKWLAVAPRAGGRARRPARSARRVQRQGARAAPLRPPAGARAGPRRRPTSSRASLDLLEHGNGAYRQRKVYEANRDFSELLQDIVARLGAVAPIKLSSRALAAAYPWMSLMSSGPDLYLVCKSCGAEVSPYITECPYCGTRIQKRAPKLDRGGVPKAPKRARSRPQLPRLRPGEIPGIRADRRPWAVWVLVLASVLVTVADQVGPARTRSTSRYAAGARRAVARVHDAVRLHLDRLRGGHRRRDRAVRLAARAPARLVGAAAGVLRLRRGRRVRRRRQVAGEGIALGANGAALGMLAAWTMRDVLGRRKGREDDSDLLGVLAIAAVLVLLPLATTDASGVAGVVGGTAGILLGLILAQLPER